MKTAIPIKSPQLLLRQISDTHYYVVNCAFPHSLRLLNRAQYEIIRAIDNHTSLADMANHLAVPIDRLERFMQLLSATDIIRFDNGFTQPQRPSSPDTLNFWIHTTNRCNLTCGYCYIPTLNTTGGMTEKTQRQLLTKLVQTVCQRRISQIRLRLAGGEPLIQFKAWQTFIPEARQVLGDLCCQLDFSFITNLTILTDEIIQFSQDNSISYGVSLDGLEAHHDRTRTFRSGQGSFATVDGNLRRLISHRIPVSISTVVGNHNLVGLPDLTRYLIDLNIPFRYAVVKGESVDADLLEKGLLDSYAVMRQAIETGWRFSRQHQFCDLKPSNLGFQTCASGFSGGAIYVDGTVHYCQVQFGDASRRSHSIFDEETDLVAMIEQGEHQEAVKSEDCQSCRYRFVCTSGCPVYRVKDKDPQCSLYHKIIPLIYDLQATERLKLLQDCPMISH